MHQITVEEAKEQFSVLIEEAINGEEVIITENDKPVAKLVSISQVKSHRQFGSAKGLIKMSDDFDAPLEDFEGYV